MVRQIQKLNEITLAGIKPQLDNVIRNRITDSKTIEPLLDELLDCAGMSEEGLELFKRLCRYYFRIDPTTTAEYIYIYRDLYDSDDNRKPKRKQYKTDRVSAKGAYQ
jgi:hypothetical protein